MKESHAIVESSRVPRRGPYSQPVRVGELVFVAGQAGLDPVTGVVPLGAAALTSYSPEDDHDQGVCRAAFAAVDAIVTDGA